MKKTTFILPLVLLSWLSQSQIVRNFNIYFDVDKYEIRSDAKSVLAEVQGLYQTNYVHKIKISAHTDSDADEMYNLRLSQNRAQTVENYLINSKIKKSKIAKTWKGEYEPIEENINAKNKQKNRRVEIQLVYEPFGDASQILDMISDDPEEFMLSTNEKTTITAKNGSKITIPKDAFVDQFGNPVPNKGVKFFVKESLTMGSAIIDQLTTYTTDGDILESGGMIKMTAEIDGKQLNIAPETELDLNLVSNNIVSDMEVFEGSTNNNGLQVWTTTSRSFIPTPFDQGLPLKLPENIFDKYKNLPLPTYNAAQLSNNPNIPRQPATLSKPREPKYPTLRTVEDMQFGFFGRLAGKKYQIKKTNKFNDRLLAKYEMAYSRYEERMDRYLKRIVTYENDIALFRKDVRNYEQEIDDMVEDLTQNFNEIKLYYDKIRLRNGINRIMTASQNNEIYTTDLEQLTVGRTSFSVKSEASELLKAIATKIYILECMKFVGPVTVLKFMDAKGKLNAKKMVAYVNRERKKGVVGVPYARSNYLIERNLLAASISGDQEVKDLFQQAVAEKRKRDEAAGYKPESALVQSYQAGIGNLGWVNCDRLTKMKFTKRVFFGAASGIIGERVIIVIHQLRSVLQPEYFERKFSTKMALNEKSTAVHIAPDGDKVMLSLVEFDPKKTTEVEPEYKEVTLAEMKEKLESIL